MRALPWIVVFAGCATQPPPQPATAPAPYEEETSEVGAREGTATPEEYQAINDQMRRKMDVLNHCYEKEMEKRMDRSFQGAVTVSITIGRDGKVSSAEILEDSLEAPDMNRCLIDTIQTFTFGSLTGEARLDYPIRFEPQY